MGHSGSPTAGGALLASAAAAKFMHNIRVKTQDEYDAYLEGLPSDEDEDYDDPSLQLTRRRSSVKGKQPVERRKKGAAKGPRGSSIKRQNSQPRGADVKAAGEPSVSAPPKA